MKIEAGQLYQAVRDTLKEEGIPKLLWVGTDIRNGKSFEAASSQTREVFTKLAANLTAEASKA